MRLPKVTPQPGQELTQVVKLQVLGTSRPALEALAGKRFEVAGVYVRMGERTTMGRTHPSLLLRDVRDAETGARIADHLWFNRGKTWQAVGLLPGDQVPFTARSMEYRKGYWGADPVLRLERPPQVEYKLTPPEGLRIVSRTARLQREAA